MKAMIEETGNSPRLYRSSRFWEILGRQNERMLAEP